MDSYHNRVNDQDFLSNQAIAISISESADLAILGLAPEHLQDAMAEVARYLLANGARLLYGGDLRPEGFTEVLFELVARHRRDAQASDTQLGVTNYLAWPVHVGMPTEQVDLLATALEGLANIEYLDMVGASMSPNKRQRPQEATAREWHQGLTTMRQRMLQDSTARIILGGTTSGFKGIMPGVAEEALLSLSRRQPLFVLGGFGGCTRLIAASLGLLQEQATAAWPYTQAFSAFTDESLYNGLTAEENRTLAQTVHIDQAITLILRGLLRSQEQSGNGDRQA